MKSQLRVLEPLDESKTVTETTFADDVRYVVVDEDDKPVRGVFNNFPLALTWLSNWPSSKRSVERKEAELAEGRRHFADWQIEELTNRRQALTLTGKPPAGIKRVVLSVRVEEANETETAILDEVLKEIVAHA